MPTILATVCFLSGTALSIMLGVVYGPAWKDKRFGFYRIACAMAFGGSLLMLGIAAGWLKPGMSIPLLAVSFLGAGIAGLAEVHLIASISSRFKQTTK
jgi:hypothetical protein